MNSNESALKMVLKSYQLISRLINHSKLKKEQKDTSNFQEIFIALSNQNK